jgi:predicted amidohydrolase
MPVGVQVCSDTMRPEGTHLLGAMGVEAVLIPRATEQATYRHWHTVFRANARTSACYVLSVNRPDSEDGVLIGGPSIAVDPSGAVLLETTERLDIVTLESAEVRRARIAYPGYLPIRARLYADAWAEIAGRDGEPA